MPKIIWRCECGAAYEMQEERLGSRVRCRQCSAVSLIEKRSITPTPPPLPKASVPSSEISGKRSISPENSAAAVNTESKNPERSQTLIWVAGILGTGTLLLLLSVLVFVFRGGSTPQPGVETEESPLVKDLRELEEKATAQRRDVQAQHPPADVQSNMPTGKVLGLEDLAELVGPSVVQVNVTGAEKGSTGSGFVLDKQGTIVTNYHVIEDATAGTVVFSDRTIAPITGYLGVWPEKDIALVRVECSPDKLHPLHLATSVPRQGERVAAFGSPLGLQQSVTEGIVSAIRESEELQTIALTEVNAILIQTTVPISPGNSGGPLVDMRGRVVGVNTMGLRGGENLNFAIGVTEFPPLLLAKSEIASPLPAPHAAGSVHRILSRAKDHHDARDYKSAIADYTEAIRRDPTNSVAYLERGTSHLMNGDLDLAIADCTEAIRLTPANPDAYRQRGVIFSLRDPNRAIADFTEAIRLNPEDFKAFSRRGGEYSQIGDFDRATIDHNKAITLDPTNDSSYSSRASMYSKKGDYDLAIADYTEAIRLAPANPFYYSFRGSVYKDKRDFDRAISDFTDSIRISPESSLFYFWRGDVYEHKHDFENAIADFTEVIHREPENARAIRARGDAYRGKGDYDRAIPDYTEAIRLDPTSSLAYYGRGESYANNYSLNRAIADYNEAVRLNPNFADAFASRGQANKKLSDYATAITDYTEAIRLDPTNGDFYGFRGEAHRLSEDFASAISDFTKAIGLDPTNVLHYRGRAFVYSDARDYERAVIEYTEAIRLNPEDASTFDARGTTYRVKRDYDNSIADHTEATRLDPTNFTSFRARGDAYREKGDYDRAIADYTEAMRLDPTRSHWSSFLNYSGRGECYLKKRDYDSAIADFTEVIQLAPTNGAAYWKRGEAYGLQGQKVFSKRDFEQATELGYDPSDSKSRERNLPKNDRKVAGNEAFPERVKVRDQWKKIAIGMPFTRVEKLLGRPNDVATFGGFATNWHYRFDWTPFSGSVSFEDGRVTGWSEPRDWGLNE